MRSAEYSALLSRFQRFKDGHTVLGKELALQIPHFVVLTSAVEVFSRSCVSVFSVAFYSGTGTVSPRTAASCTSSYQLPSWPVLQEGLGCLKPRNTYSEHNFENSTFSSKAVKSTSKHSGRGTGGAASPQSGAGCLASAPGFWCQSTRDRASGPPTRGRLKNIL